MYYLMYMNRNQGPFRIQINRDNCTDCARCLAACRQHVFSVSGGEIIVAQESECNGCRKCMDICLYGALSFISEPSQSDGMNESDDRGSSK